MAGNSRRTGAIRKTPKRGPRVGSGGQRRRGLEGKGPTPAAEFRPGHPKARRAAAAARGGTPGKPRAAAPRSAEAKPAAGGRQPGAARAGKPSKTGKTGKDIRPETIAGRNAVVEALRAGVPATTLYVAARVESDDRVREALRLSTARGLPLLEMSRQELDRLTAGALHQGLALQVPAYSYAEPPGLLERARDAAAQPLVVALDGVTDPRNLGAVVRSVAAFGGHGVVVPERRAAGMTAAAWKSSAGAAARVPVARATNLTRALEDYRKAGLFVVGLDADADLDLDALELAAEPLVLVIGSEGKGLSRLVRATCDVVLRIPMTADTESLNAGVAAGIALYEIARRRR